MAGPSQKSRHTKRIYPTIPGSRALVTYRSTRFQMRLSYIIEEVLSPIVTPYVLIFKLRYRAHEIIDFFRQNTTDIQGVGDVCKLAQLDLKQPSSQSDSYDQDGPSKLCK